MIMLHRKKKENNRISRIASRQDEEKNAPDFSYPAAKRSCLSCCFFLLFFFSCAHILATPSPVDSGSVSSTSAAYDGNALVLKGQVVLDHGLGKMSAEEASLERQEAGKDFPFSLIHLSKDVLLSLRKNLEVRSAKADLDFVSLKGILQNQVSITDNTKKKIAFRIVSDQVDLDFSKKGENEYDIETIFAKNGVVIDYGAGFTLHADHAIFRKQLPKDKKQIGSLAGIVTAYPANKESTCRLTHGEDIVDADSVDLDLNTSKFSLHHPKGHFLSPKGKVAFSSDQLIWDNLKNILTLKGAIQIQEEALGTLTSDNEVQLTQNNGELTTILAKGKTTLQYKDTTSHLLLSHGQMHLDRAKLSANLESPTVDGAVPKGKQIYYQEDKIAALADTASVEYTQNGTKLQPVSVALKGNVRLFSHDVNAKTRCGLADRVTFSPTTRTCILGANPGKRVLFWDDEESVRISATEVHITQDGVKGVGNVQFSFTSDEDALLKQSFAEYLQ